jgi:SagB-type dehydrogenase family enzyme
VHPYRHTRAPVARQANVQVPRDWYVAEGQRGEQLLAAGQITQAVSVFEALLARLGLEPTYPAAVALGRLAHCLHLSGLSAQAIERLQQALAIAAALAPSTGSKSLRGTLHSELGEVLRTIGQHDRAREALMIALGIARELRDLRAEGVELSHLGALAAVQGRHEEALDRYRAALALFQQIGEASMQGAAWHQLGAVFHQQQQWQQAERHYLEAARVRERHADPAAAAQSWNQLGLLHQQAGRPEDAEVWYRRAIEADRFADNRLQLGSHLGNLANLLQHLGGRLGEARQLAEAALSVHRRVDLTTPQVWNNYGVLADILAKEAANSTDAERQAALQAQARHCRQLQEFAPRFVAALARLGPDGGYARAVVLGRLARCLYSSGRSDAAIANLRQALAVAAGLVAGESVGALRAWLHAELGEVYRALGQRESALQAFDDARKLEEETQASPAGIAVQGAGRPLRIVVEEELFTDYGLDADLLVDGPRQRRVAEWAAATPFLAGDVRPALLPCVRTAIDDEAAIRFFLPTTEPIFERHPGCIVMRRARREVAVSGNVAIVWRLVRAIDGTRCIADLLSGFAAEDRSTAAYALGALADIGALDVSGRPLGRFLHSSTKKGVLPAGGLEGDDVLQLATDGDYRSYPGARSLSLGRAVPDRLGSFHALTRSRRSRRDYDGRALKRDDFDALLLTACGVTGAVSWAGREVALRAYPASGALYAVEIYPVVLRVEDLAPGVYHYRAADHSLEAVGAAFDQTAFVEAMLPTERVMVAGAAAMICLTGRFARHERKYGEGGYRMLAAETGHVSQNLVLAATALGLSARPFGGVFDALLNHELGLDSDQEQFLLSVVVGHAGGGDGR